MRLLINTNHYLSIQEKILTFHTDNVITGNTSWIEAAYRKHLNDTF